MGAVIPFPDRRLRGNCERCGSILDGELHDCEAAIHFQRHILWANGHRDEDEGLPADVQAMLRGWSPESCRDCHPNLNPPPRPRAA